MAAHHHTGVLLGHLGPDPGVTWDSEQRPKAAVTIRTMTFT